MEESGYDGFYVLEQDCVVRGAEPAVGEGAMTEVAKSLTFISEI